MSQSATLYRISQDSFDKLKEFDNKQLLEFPTMAKDYYTFQGSFLGLEYVLSKGKDSKTIDVILEIFNPQQQLIGKDYDNFSVDERFDFLYELPVRFILGQIRNFTDS